MNIVEFHSSRPRKFGSKKVREKEDEQGSKQLNLFNRGRILPLHSKTAFEEALMMDQRGDDESARELYLQAIQNGDQIADAYCNLGILEAQKGEMVKAIDHLTRSLKYEPRHLEAHFNLANAYADMGDFKLAKLHYEVSIQIDPEFPSSYFNLGIMLASDKQYEEAIEAIKKYRQLVPGQEFQSASDLIEKLSNMIN
jgi:tetratricopeptide (TPR) repeat protein